MRFEGGARGVVILSQMSAGRKNHLHWEMRDPGLLAPPAEPDYPTFADGHEQALIGDAIARSHAEGRWVAVAR